MVKKIFEVLTVEEKKSFKDLWVIADKIKYGNGSTAKQRRELSKSLYKLHDDFARLLNTKMNEKSKSIIKPNNILVIDEGLLGTNADSEKTKNEFNGSKKQHIICSTINILLEQLRPIQKDLDKEEKLDQLNDEQITNQNILDFLMVELYDFRIILEDILKIKGVNKE